MASRNRSVVTSVPADESIPEHVRESVLAAAYDEITRWGIDRFSIVSLAGRHELAPELIRHHWGGEADEQDRGDFAAGEIQGEPRPHKA